jgi:hypothetical protein
MYLTITLFSEMTCFHGTILITFQILFVSFDFILVYCYTSVFIFICLLHNLCSSLSLIRQFKSRIMRWAGHAARMGEEGKVYKVMVGKPEWKRPFKNRGVDGRTGVEWTFKKLAGGCGVNSAGSGQRPAAGSCECCHEPSGSSATELVSLRVTGFCCRQERK